MVKIQKWWYLHENMELSTFQGTIPNAERRKCSEIPGLRKKKNDLHHLHIQERQIIIPSSVLIPKTMQYTTIKLHTALLLRGQPSL